MATLPVDDALPALRSALATHAAAVLQAPPGAGKTTRVPGALLDAPWLGMRRIVMLEPRRLAARTAARYMARARGEAVGETVGFRVRGETRVGPRTRIEVVTEGVLTRMLQDDPALEGTGAVIFDEFHERSLHADAGLALTLQTQALLRDDLRILVMSATLDGARVAALLGDAPVIASEGRAYPVETHYRERPVDGWIEPAVAAAVREALDRHEGDVLVFLPGAGEIRRVEERLADPPLGPRVRVRALHGTLSPEAQDAAIAPSPAGERKVVLATSIAETSLTIEGVRVVIDAGLMRVPRFSPRTGMTRLETVRVSGASADQRRGRAGRLGPGDCYRLWTVQEQAGLTPFAAPEILAADLAPLALDLAVLGVRDPAELRWLDPPPAAAFAQARALLAALGALDADGRLTAHGGEMARFGLQPRLAHMLLKARGLDLGGLAADLAAVLEERDPLRGQGGPPEADLRLRVEAVAHGPGAVRGAGLSVDMGVVQRVRELARTLGRGARDARVTGSDATGLLLAFAYPDRIAQRRANAAGRFLLANGRGAALPAHDPLAMAPWLVVAALDDAGTEGRIFLAAPVDQAELETHAADQITEADETVLDPVTRAVEARRRRKLGAIVLQDAPLRDPDPVLIAGALLDALRREGLGLLGWSDAARHLRQRIAFVHRQDSAWPDVSDPTLLASLDTWLAPRLTGVRRLDDLARVDLIAALRGLLAWDQSRALDELAPERIEVPSGSHIAIDYADPEAPVLAVKLQEMFGLAETPRIARGAVPLTLHLLSPARRPVQVTRDLAGFWRGSYAEVRKELRGRYPKHPWPDDPLAAPATRFTKRRAGS